MPIPPAFLQQIESHACFSGCFHASSTVQAALSPAFILEPLTVVTCEDCLKHFGLPASTLPAGLDAYRLADELTDHLRKLRGFSSSIAGYHVKPAGFWLSAVYLSPAGLFLLDGRKSQSKQTDLDLLIQLLSLGIWALGDPQMLDPRHYVLETGFVQFAAPVTPLRSKQDLISSPHYHPTPKRGFERVTLAEYLPVSRGAAAPPAVPTSTAAPVTAAAPVSAAGGPAGPLVQIAPGASKAALQPAAAHAIAAASQPAIAKAQQPGDICPKCGAEIRERLLLNSSFVGCLC